MPQRLASLVFDLAVGNNGFRLLPPGEFASADGSGRPHDVASWRLDAAHAAQLVAKDRARANRRVIDYEHQTLLSAKNGQKAPASGWMQRLEWRDGDGLYVVPDWTAAATAHIDAKEYRYISPVFTYDADGWVTDVLMAGLTNNPGLDGLTDLAALSALFPDDPVPDNQETHFMKAILKALGLAETATESEALAALAAIQTKAGDSETRVTALTAEVATLKAAAPDPAKFVPVDAVTKLQEQVAALSATLASNELDDLVESGLADGRLNAALEPWARSLTPAALKAYLDKATPIAALKGTQTGGKKPAGADAGGDDAIPADEVAAKAKFAGSAALRAEFGEFSTYWAYCQVAPKTA